MHQTTLNAAQQEAANTLEGPLLILAGAGAGKTKTLTHRMLHLIERGIAPEAILAVTFTNKAAAEMRERTLALLEEDTQTNFPVAQTTSPFVSTFHSLGVSLLRNHAEMLGLTRHFTIYDRNDSISAMKKAVQEAGLDPKQFAPRTLLGTIGKQKGDAVSRDAYTQNAGNEFYPRIVSDVWARYERILREDKALDFDDLLLSTLTLLKRDAALREHYQNRWQYIHIDEYQDTNTVQYEIANILAAKHRNICCVGDIDQNIYAWRGADISNILNFETHYPEARTIVLEENYRSTKTIIAVSNDIIEKNLNRRKKTLYTNNDDGEKMTLFVAYDEADEADYIARTAKELVADGVDPEEIAVLYRANFQSRALEEGFITYGVPYQVLGVRFFDRKEVKDVLTFIRAALNRSSGDISRIVGVPPRGIGKTTLVKMLAGDTTFSPAVKKKVDAFYELLDSIAHTAQTKKPSETVRFVVEATGLEEHLKGKSEEDQERLENIKELASLAKKYDSLEPNEGIARLLDDASLATDQDELQTHQRAVRLMTIHAAKGLEFKYVFITGLEDGLFPHEKLGENADHEEERRLFYVALTRAKIKVFLTYTNARTIYGSRQVNLPSEFITDIDPLYLEQEENSSSAAITTIYLD